jgi:hypothetical protein
MDGLVLRARQQHGGIVTAEPANVTNGVEHKRDHITRKLCVNAINSRPDRDFGYEDLCLAVGEKLDRRSVLIKLARAARDGEVQRTARERYAALSYVGARGHEPVRRLLTQPARATLPQPEPPAAATSALTLLYAKRAELQAELAGYETAIKALGGR